MTFTGHEKATRRLYMAEKGSRGQLMANFENPKFEILNSKQYPNNNSLMTQMSFYGNVVTHCNFLRGVCVCAVYVSV
jgi:hypothetical protein